MQPVSSPSDDVYSLAEIASAAGVPTRCVRDLRDAGLLTTHGDFADRAAAVTAVRLLRAGWLGRNGHHRHGATGRPGVGTVASASIHGGILGTLVLWSALGPAVAAPASTEPREPVRLVFLSRPGPGGGGGGGGTRQPQPASQARRRGSTQMRSPVVATPVPRSRDEAAETRPVVAREPEARTAESPAPPAAPPVVAPVAPVSADPETTPGAVASPAPEPSQGPGQGGGSGTGEGTGLGEGSGAGIGDGSGGGTGGGPYRPGSGITPPRLLHEVRPDYTEEARRRGISGEVELEVLVQRDGRVGPVRILRGLGAGLDQRAVDAIRQWRFSPATRLGSPVDVLVEVAVEFRLR